MKALDKFSIEIYKLSNAEHIYEFELDEAFFSNFENSPVEKGSVQAQVTLNKHETFIEANFSFKGTIELTCDRSLEIFDAPVDHTGKLIYKYGEEEMEVDDEIIIITKNTQRINVAQFMYESISLSIPFKKLHPKFSDEESDNSDGMMVYVDPSSETAGDHEVENENKEKTDPRWDILKKLKDN